MKWNTLSISKKYKREDILLNLIKEEIRLWNVINSLSKEIDTRDTIQNLVDEISEKEESRKKKKKEGEKKHCHEMDLLKFWSNRIN